MLPSVLTFYSLFINPPPCDILFPHAGNFTDKIKYPCLHNITDPVNYPCLGNQGSYLVNHLVQKRLWSFTRLPIDGMRSVVFHGPSPTLCIGGGNVWMDSLWYNNDTSTAHQLCITPKDALRIDDSPHTMKITFDLEHYFHQNHILGVCMRARNPDAPGLNLTYFDPHQFRRLSVE